MSFDTRVRLLLVDDDPGDRETVRNLIQAIQGWKVSLTWAPSYGEGLKALARSHFDAALVDHRLGERSGLDFVREGSVKREGLPVIVLTGEGNPEADLRATEAGAVDTLLKDGLTAAVLQRSIRYAIEARRRTGVEARFRAVVENARDLVSVVDPDGLLVYVSPSLHRVLGFRPEDRLGTTLWDHLHPDDLPAARAMFGELKSDPGGSRRILARAAHADGTWRTLDTVARNLLDDPMVGGIVVNSWDVTELDAAQAALRRRQSELQERIKELQCLYRVYRTLQRSDLGWEEAVEGVVEGIPPGFQLPERIEARIRVGDVVRQTPGFRPTDWSLAAPIQVGREDLGLVEVAFPEPPPRELEDTFLDEEAELLGAIADRVGEAVRSRRAEADLRRSEAYFRALAERSGRVIAVVDRDGEVRYVSDEARHLFEDEPANVLGTPIARLLSSGEAPDEFAESLRQAIQDPAASVDGRTSIRHSILGERTLHYTLRSLLEDPAVRGVVVTVHDATPREEQESRIRFQAELLDAVGQAVIASDLAGTVVYWNRAAEEVFGWSRDEALGRTVYELTTPDEGGPQARDIMSEVEAGQRWSGEFVLERKDGSRFPGFVTTSTIVDRTGEVTGVIGISSDLTDRKALEEQLRQAQKMEAVGRLAGGVAHDFNNLLTAIHGHVELLLQDLPPESPIVEDLREIQRAGVRASELTRQLLAFGRKQPREERVLDLREVVSEMEPLLRRLLGSGHELRIGVPPTPVAVRADAGQIHQVVLNLAVNARDAMPENGRLTIQVDAEGPALGDLAAGRRARVRTARLTVRDTGSGIAENDLPHIFEPFYTTKAAGRGSGLGLSTVFGIVSQSGGEVRVDSRGGEGTTFTVLLPLEEADPEPAAEPASEPRGVSGEETILVVEDDPAVRAIARRILERVGYSVLEAANGVQALQIARERSSEIHLVLTDVVMPEMGGTRLADELRREHPGVKVVLTSGYSEEDLVGDVRGKGSAFIEKPFTVHDLTRVVRGVLDG